MERRYMQIGEVAARSRLTHRTLRFYEEKGLLDPPTRMEGGFRLYSEEDVRRIEHVLELKHLLGFSLAQIKEMLDAERLIEQIRAAYHQQELDLATKKTRLEEGIRVVQTQAAMIDQKLDQLRAMRQRWQQRLERYIERHAEIVLEVDSQVPAGSR